MFRLNNFVLGLVLLGCLFSLLPSLMNVEVLAISTPGTGCVTIPGGDIRPPWKKAVNGNTGSIKISDAYGVNNHKYCNRAGGANDYHAVDFLLAKRDNIVASASGKVILAEMLTGGWCAYGRTIVIEDNRTYNGKKIYHLYAHLDEISVKSGDTISAGSTIGYTGQTTCSGTTAVHLHYAVYLGASIKPSTDGKSKGPAGGQGVVPEPIVDSKCTPTKRYENLVSGMSIISCKL